MFPRLRWLTFVFAACVATTHFNCIVHSAQGAGALIEALRLADAGQDYPMQGDLLRCLNESGCICRGAVLTVLAIAPALALSAWDFMCLPSTTVASVLNKPLADMPPPDTPCRSCAPKSGKILRTLLSSFLC